MEVQGPLDENFYVFDFIALKKAAKVIVDELDHDMLLPTNNPVIHIQEQGAEVHAQYKDRRWIFPRGDCVLLPIENTTAETARPLHRRSVCSPTCATSTAFCQTCFAWRWKKDREDHH